MAEQGQTMSLAELRAKKAAAAAASKTGGRAVAGAAKGPSRPPSGAVGSTAARRATGAPTSSAARTAATSSSNNSTVVDRVKQDRADANRRELAAQKEKRMADIKARDAQKRQAVDERRKRLEEEEKAKRLKQLKSRETRSRPDLSTIGVAASAGSRRQSGIGVSASLSRSTTALSAGRPAHGAGSTSAMGGGRAASGSLSTSTSRMNAAGLSQSAAGMGSSARAAGSKVAGSRPSNPSAAATTTTTARAGTGTSAATPQKSKLPARAPVSAHRQIAGAASSSVPRPHTTGRELHAGGRSIPGSRIPRKAGSTLSSAGNSRVTSPTNSRPPSLDFGDMQRSPQSPGEPSPAAALLRHEDEEAERLAALEREREEEEQRLFDEEELATQREADHMEELATQREAEHMEELQATERESETQRRLEFEENERRREEERIREEQEWLLRRQQAAQKQKHEEEEKEQHRQRQLEQEEEEQRQRREAEDLELRRKENIQLKLEQEEKERQRKMEEEAIKEAEEKEQLRLKQEEEEEEEEKDRKRREAEEEELRQKAERQRALEEADAQRRQEQERNRLEDEKRQRQLAEQQAELERQRQAKQKQMDLEQAERDARRERIQKIMDKTRRPQSGGLTESKAEVTTAVNISVNHVETAPQAPVPQLSSKEVLPKLRPSTERAADIASTWRQDDTLASTSSPPGCDDDSRKTSSVSGVEVGSVVERLISQKQNAGGDDDDDDWDVPSSPALSVGDLRSELRDAEDDQCSSGMSGNELEHSTSSLSSSASMGSRSLGGSRQSLGGRVSAAAAMQRHVTTLPVQPPTLAGRPKSAEVSLLPPAGQRPASAGNAKSADTNAATSERKADVLPTASRSSGKGEDLPPIGIPRVHAMLGSSSGDPRAIAEEAMSRRSGLRSTASPRQSSSSTPGVKETDDQATPTQKSFDLRSSPRTPQFSKPAEAYPAERITPAGRHGTTPMQQPARDGLSQSPATPMNISLTSAQVSSSKGSSPHLNSSTLSSTTTPRNVETPRAMEPCNDAHPELPNEPPPGLPDEPPPGLPNEPPPGLPNEPPPGLPNEPPPGLPNEPPPGLPTEPPPGLPSSSSRDSSWSGASSLDMDSSASDPPELPNSLPPGDGSEPPHMPSGHLAYADAGPTNMPRSASSSIDLSLVTMSPAGPQPVPRARKKLSESPDGSLSPTASTVPRALPRSTSTTSTTSPAPEKGEPDPLSPDVTGALSRGQPTQQDVHDEERQAILHEEKAEKHGSSFDTGEWHGVEAAMRTTSQHIGQFLGQRGLAAPRENEDELWRILTQGNAAMDATAPGPSTPEQQDDVDAMDDYNSEDDYLATDDEGLV